uniref:Protein phosphatase 1 regulatory subunit 1A n=1 Tax=Aquila chrysaetos chrysaetos TaxID=223781 RepID=A0A663EKW4_AQUCH
MEPNSPRKIQFTVPLLEPHLDPEAAEQIRRRRPTPANLVLSSDQSSPEIDEDRLPNPLLKSGLAMSPRQRKKVSRTTPTMKGILGGGGGATQGVTVCVPPPGDEREGCHHLCAGLGPAQPCPGQERGCARGHTGSSRGKCHQRGQEATKLAGLHLPGVTGSVGTVTASSSSPPPPPPPPPPQHRSLPGRAADDGGASPVQAGAGRRGRGGSRRRRRPGAWPWPLPPQ